LSLSVIDNDNHSGGGRIGEVYLAYPLDGFSPSFGSIEIALITDLWANKDRN
jgi:hypothetical protein